MLFFSGAQSFPVWTDVVFRSIFQNPFKILSKNYDFTQFYHFFMVK